MKRLWPIMKREYARRKRKSNMPDAMITKASNFNRALLVLCVVLLVLNFFKLRQLSISTAGMNSKFITQEIAVRANTKQILDFMKQWTDTQQQLSNWMQQQVNVQNEIKQNNPKLKMPKPPPVPPSLPTPQVRVVPEPSPTPALTPKPKKKGSRKARPTPTPASFKWEQLFKRRHDPRNTRLILRLE